MAIKKIATAIVVATLAAGGAFAQPKSTTPSAPPATPSKALPTAGAPTAPAKTAAPAANPLPAGAKVNLNTATAEELDTLPDIGPARTKVIQAERAKAKFKDWADFETRMANTTINKGVQAKIKDRVTF